MVRGQRGKRGQHSQRSVRSLNKTGGGKSFSLTLPLELIKKLGWKEKQKVTVKPKGKSLIIRDWKKK
ncbi:MAG: AbrB/MazE/SpoVT family DNA-binding domain-containing protein [Patescibacteria group bacterium]